jgi:hypothetical protein
MYHSGGRTLVRLRNSIYNTKQYKYKYRIQATSILPYPSLHVEDVCTETESEAECSLIFRSKNKCRGPQGHKPVGTAPFQRIVLESHPQPPFHHKTFSSFSQRRISYQSTTKRKGPISIPRLLFRYSKEDLNTFR